MKLLKEQCIDKGYYYEFVGDIFTNEPFECDFPLKVGGSLEGRITMTAHCKWRVSVSKTDIKIGCVTATVEVWGKRFTENWHKETNPNTHEYAMIKAAYQVARVYFLNVMPLIGAKLEADQ